MNILIVTDSYPPEIRSASHLMQELACELKNRGHKITVITTYPRYNLVEEFKEKVFQEFVNEDGINVIRIKTLSHHKVNFNYRGFAQLTMPFLFYFKGKKYFDKNIDLVIVYSPPLPLALFGKFIKNKYNAKYVLNVQDIFPQNAIDLKILTNPILIKFFEYIENQAYKSADEITVHSEGNKKFLLQSKNIDPNKLHILHNWIDVDLYIKAKNEGRFRKKYGLEEKFIFLFAGVTGPAQELDLVINAASQLQDLKDACFLIVGDGTKKEHLVKLSQSLELKNVIFKPFVSKDEYPFLVKEANVGIVCLSNKNKTPVVPGKILGYMASSIPVLAFLNKESDAHLLIKEANCGFTMTSDNHKEAASLIMNIYKQRDSLKIYGENGLKYVLNHFEKGICVSRLERLFGALNGR